MADSSDDEEITPWESVHEEGLYAKILGFLPPEDKGNLAAVNQKMARIAEESRHTPEQKKHYELIMLFKHFMQSKQNIDLATELLLELLKEPESHHLVNDNGFYTSMDGHNLAKDLKILLWPTWIGSAGNWHGVTYGSSLCVAELMHHCVETNRITELAEAILSHITIEINSAFEPYDKMYCTKPSRLTYNPVKIRHGSNWHQIHLECCIDTEGKKQIFFYKVMDGGYTIHECIFEQEKGQTEWTRHPQNFKARIVMAVEHLLVHNTNGWLEAPMLKAAFADTCM